MPRMELVQQSDMATHLATYDAGEVDRIITSPPYTGLPGRADTRSIVADLLRAAGSILADDGTVTLIVGSTAGNPLLPFDLARNIADHSHGRLALHSWYVWDRRGTLARDIGNQIVTHDIILHIARARAARTRSLSQTSIIGTQQHGFNYGHGVTTPPDLAAFLIDAATNRGDLVVDPLCGLGEIGVQALNQGRRFAGCDMSSACVEIANARLAEFTCCTAGAKADGHVCNVDPVPI